MPKNFWKIFPVVLLCVWALCSPISSAAESGALRVEPQALDIVGIYQVKSLEPNLLGEGVNLGVISRSLTYVNGEPQNDYRPRVIHNCFSKKKIRFFDEGKSAAGVSPHSTAVCSILFGEDAGGYDKQLGQFRYEGILPRGQGNVYEFWHFVTNYILGDSAIESDILTASIGTEFEDWWTRGIGAIVEHQDVIVVAGIGNGSNAHDPPLYPGAGANMLGVGVVDSVDSNDLAIELSRFSLAYPEFSSCGPTGDNRSKPDIVAPGNCLAADINDVNSYQPTGSYSSFSTPIVAGTIGLLVEKAKQSEGLGEAISPYVMKAIVMNSATKLPYWHKGRVEKEDDHVIPLDYAQGAGMLNAVGAYKQLVAGVNKPGKSSSVGWDKNKLRGSEPDNTYRIKIDKANELCFTGTLVWNRHYQSSYPFEPNRASDSDLRLELWAVDHNDPNNDRLIDYSDSYTDNIEHIYCEMDANHTDYELVVTFSDVNDPNALSIEGYGLAWNVGEKPLDDMTARCDINADGIVNDPDVMTLMGNLLNSMNSSDSYLMGDIDGDGRIDVNDLHILMEQTDRKADWLKE
ncbi:S8 family serine peptidase [Planctomycetota bacterium]